MPELSRGELVWIFGTPEGWGAELEALVLEPIGELV